MHWVQLCFSQTAKLPYLCKAGLCSLPCDGLYCIHPAGPYSSTVRHSLCEVCCMANTVLSCAASTVLSDVSFTVQRMTSSTLQGFATVTAGGFAIPTLPCYAVLHPCCRPVLHPLLQALQLYRKAPEPVEDYAAAQARKSEAMKRARGEACWFSGMLAFERRVTVACRHTTRFLRDSSLGV